MRASIGSSRGEIERERTLDELVALFARVWRGAVGVVVLLARNRAVLLWRHSPTLQIRATSSSLVVRRARILNNEGIVRRVLILLALPAMVLSTSACTPSDPPPAHPNVLLVSIDTLRSDHLGAYGYERDTSPSMDRLAREGVLFESAISASSWTLPSHTTLLTGMPPEAHGVDTSRKRLVDEAVTLAETFRGAGYTTAAFVSGPYLRALYGHDQGFETYDESTVWPKRDVHTKPTSPQLERLVVEWLEAWQGSSNPRPFFVFLHMWDPHYDFMPPPPYDTLFDPDYQGELGGAIFDTDQVRPDMEPRDLEHLIALYDGEIRFTDDHLGRILAELERVGVSEDTIVIVTSDHGEEFFEHGQKGHSKGLYEEVVRIPWIIRYPRRVAPGQRFSQQVRLMDVGPTILGLAGVEGDFGTGSQAAFRERDLSPWLLGLESPASFPRLTAFLHEAAFVRRHAIRTPQHKLIDVRRQKGRSVEVYDLRVDPGERNNLESQTKHAWTRGNLQRRLNAWRKHWGVGPRFSDSVSLDPADVEQLRALGYLE